MIEGSSKIQQKYEEALKNTKDFVVLCKGKGVELDSEDFSTNQSSSSLRITPAVISADESTVICGYFVEPGTDRGECDKVRDEERRQVGITELSNMDEFVFYNINDSGRPIVIPAGKLRKAKKKHKKNVKFEKPEVLVEENKTNESTFIDSLIDDTLNDCSFECEEDPIKPYLEVYASIGGTIVTRNKEKKLIPYTKIPGSVYVGSVAFKTKALSSVLKFYLDQNLYTTANSILQDERVRKVLIELCT